MAVAFPTATTDRNTQGKREFSVADEYQYNQSGPVRWLWSHLRRYPLLIASFLITATLTNVLFAAVPRITGIAFDEILRPDPSRARLTTIALGLLAIVITRGVIDLTNAFSIETLGQRLERDSRDELYINLLGKSQTFHNRQRVGDIMARAANDVRQLNPMMNPGVALIFESMMGIVSPLIFIGFLRVELLLAPLLWVVGYYFALRLYMRQLNPVAGAQRMQFGEMNAGLNETISGIEVVKSTVQEAQEKRNFVRNAAKYRDLFVEQGKVQARYLPQLLLGFALTIAFVHGLFLFQREALTVGDFVAYMGLMGILRFPAFISIFTFSLVQLGLAGTERILSLMQEESELDENASGHAATMRGEVEFENVTFYFNPEQDATPVLRNLSFRAAPGQSVAIVGRRAPASRR